MPERIQLRRTKGWRKPEGAIVVSRPSKWGNPFRIVPRDVGAGFHIYGPDGWVGPYWYETRAEAAAQAVREFGSYLFWGNPAFGSLDRISELRGHDLCCWCALDQPCHADTLLVLANA